MNRRSLHVLLLLLLASVALYWMATAPEVVPPAPPSKSDHAAETTAAGKPAPTAAAVSPNPGAGVPADTLAKGPADPARHRRAYLLTLDGGKLTLEGRQDIRGDFALARNEEEEELWPGMLRCRLISATGAVLAEELMPAPDQLCMVLDGAKPVAYRPPGPVMFQARLPRVADAVRLDVSRVAARDGTAPDILLGSIPLTP